nr:Os04g0664666 [Ipomoea batatas]
MYSAVEDQIKYNAFDFIELKITVKRIANLLEGGQVVLEKRNKSIDASISDEGREQKHHPFCREKCRHEDVRAENVLVHVGGWNKAVFLGNNLGIREIYEGSEVVVVDLRNGVVDELCCVGKRLAQRARPSTEILMWVVSKPPRFLALVMARHRCATRLSKVLYGLAPPFMAEALALSLARNSKLHNPFETRVKVEQRRRRLERHYLIKSGVTRRLYKFHSFIIQQNDRVPLLVFAQSPRPLPIHSKRFSKPQLDGAIRRGGRAIRVNNSNLSIIRDLIKHTKRNMACC